MKMRYQGQTARFGAVRRLTKSACAGLLSAATLYSATASAAQIPTSDIPLFLGQATRPNVFFELDDSGSMDFELMTEPHWHFCAYDSNAPDREGSYECGSRIDTGLIQGYTGSSYTDFHYMYDNSDDVYNNRDAVFEKGDSVTDNDWRVIAPSFNKLYFSPDESYEPWPGESDQDFTSARSDPEQGKDGYDDTKDLTGFEFAIWEDNAGYDGPRPQRGGASGGIADAIVDHSSEPGTTASSGSHSFALYGEPEHGQMEIATVNLAGVTGSSSVTIDYWAAQASDSSSIDPPEANEDLVLEYRNSSGNWIEVERLSGGDPDGRTYNRSVTIDAADNHADLALRFRHSGGTWEDAWYVDDIDVNEGGSGVFREEVSGGTLDANIGDVWPGTKVNYVENPNGEVDLWDDHKLVTVKSSGIEVVEVTYSPDTSGLNRSTTTVSGATAQGQFGMTLSELKQNIANWYSFYRRRSLTTKASVGAVIEDNPSFRYGLSVINKDEDLFVEVPSATSGDFSSHNDSLYDSLKDFDFPGAGTPLKDGLLRTGKYFDNELSGKDDPIDLSCQKNFSLLMSDGHYNDEDVFDTDQDGDGIKNTLADIGRKYYEKDLSPKENDVPPDPVDPATYQHMVTFPVAFGVEGQLTDTDGDGWPDPDLAVDDVWGGDPTACANKQCPEKIDDMWHTAFNTKGRFVSAESPQALTEAMGAALESVAERGASTAALAVNSGTVQSDSKFFQAKFNSANWTGNLLAVPLEQKTNNGITKTTADSSEPVWAADEVNEGIDPTSREIATYKPSTGKGIPFQWPTNPSSPGTDELDLDQIEALNTNPESNSIDNKGADRLAFLRGDRSNEADNGGTFRDRDSVYGDFVNSAPVYVGRPAFLYPDQWPSPSNETPYSEFVQNQKDRTPIVYVGGNDGMLHGFNADTGDEVFNYVPNAVFDDLNELTSQDYSHQFYVNGPPTYGDAFFDGSWHSVLVGGLGRGGQGIYALDITEPSQLNESSAGDVVLWEFGDEDTSTASKAANGDKDLGLTLSDPSIVRMNNGDWVAIFGNGYNNTIADGSASSTGNAVLYVVDVGTGRLIKKFDTKVGQDDDPQNDSRPNGLSSPAVVDANGDSIADYIYAGDMFGNLWKFDVTSSNVSDWEIAGGSGGDPEPLFTTESPNGNRQPITARPEVGSHPNGEGRIIYFGTGKYLAESDDTQVDQTTQSFYGVWDRVDKNGKQTTFTPDDLIEQGVLREETVTRESEFSGDDVDSTIRITSDKDIKWFDGDNSNNNDDGGWVFHMTKPVGIGNASDIGDGTHDNRGERAVNDPTLRDERIIFTTTIPSGDACDFGGKSFIMELDRADGGRLSVSPFDLNEDTNRDSEDESDNGRKPGGLLTQRGLASSSTALPSEGGEKKAISNSSGKIEVIDNQPPDRRKGRQSWQELR